MFSMTRYKVRNKMLIPWINFIWYFEKTDAVVSHKLLPTDDIDVLSNSYNTSLSYYDRFIKNKEVFLCVLLQRSSR